MKDDKLTMLMILDGFGDNKNKDGNAIKLANIFKYRQNNESYPNTDIYTSGLQVGLPEKTMEIQKVGHTNWSRKNSISRINKNYKINKRWRLFQNREFIRLLKIVKKIIQNCIF